MLRPTCFRRMYVKQSPALAELVQQVTLLPAFCDSLGTTKIEVPVVRNFDGLATYIRMHRPCIIRPEDGPLEGLDPEAWNLTAVLDEVGDLTVPARFQRLDPALKGVFPSMGNKKVKFSEAFSQMVSKGEECEIYLANLKIPQWFRGMQSRVRPFFNMVIESKLFAGSAGSPLVYMGAGRQATSLHFDPTENLLAVVEGEKTGILFPPCVTPYAMPMGGNIASLITLFKGVLPAVYSKWNGPIDTIPPEQMENCPAMKRLRHEVKLQTGDILYIPSCWWHFFRGGEGINTAIAFNFVPHPSKSPPQPFNSFKKGGSGPKFWGKPNGAGEKIRTGS